MRTFAFDSFSNLSRVLILNTVMFTALVIGILFLTPSVSFGSSPSSSNIVNGAGSSFAYPAYATWAYFYKGESQRTVNYQSTGSSAGIKSLKSGEVSFAGTDAPLSGSELEEYGFVQFPTFTGAIVIVVNIDGVNGHKLVLNGDIIARIFAGDINVWNHESIVELNPNIRLTSDNIVVVHRSDGSGTTYAFSDYLSSVSALWKSKFNVDKVIPWPVGIGAKGNEGVASQVKKIKNSIGYVELSFAKSSKMDIPQLINLNGKRVHPSNKGVHSAALHAQWQKDNGYQASLVNQAGDLTWPIVTPTYIVIDTNSNNVDSIIEFVEWGFDNGNPSMSKLGYDPLPTKIKEDIMDTVLDIEQITTNDSDR